MTLEKSKYSETIDHLLIKKFLFDNLPLVNEIKNIEQEIKIGKRRADIYIELKNEKKIVIEIQHSRISVKEIEQRTREYNQNNIYLLWILDGYGPFDRQPKNEDKIDISESELKLHLLYHNRVYYMNASTGGIESPVYALHFTPYFLEKVSMAKIIYYKESTKYRSVVHGEVPSLQLKLFRYKGFKLARFTDDSILDKCIFEVRQFLDKYLYYKRFYPERIKERFPNGLPLAALNNRFKKKYGLYLLFNVLKQHLKIFKIIDAFCMFNKSERIWHRRYILP